MTIGQPTRSFDGMCDPTVEDNDLDSISFTSTSLSTNQTEVSGKVQPFICLIVKFNAQVEKN